MTKKLVEYEVKNNVAKIKLCRSEKLNAFNIEMVRQLNQTWDMFERDEDARVAILLSDGRAFSSGVDLSGDISIPLAPAVPGIGIEVTKPIVSAINGHCIGVGLVLAIMTDIRIASEDTQFSYPEAKIGFSGGVGSLLTRYIPFGVAMEMLLAGDSISAKQAYDFGLINRMVKHDDLIIEAEKTAEKIANNAPLVVKTLKELAYNPHIMEISGKGNRMISSLKNSEDLKEGVSAFFDKREPNFSGK